MSAILGCPLLDDLLEALRAEFAGDVTFHASVPSTITAPAIIVAPSDPFLTNDTHGTIRETWDVIVAVSLKDPTRGLDTARDLSLRLRRATGTVGAHWSQAAGFRVPSDSNLQAVTINTVYFRYDPTEVVA